MQFVKPIPFQDAMDLIGDKSPIGAALSSSEWADVPVELSQRAMFSANVENVRFLQRAQDALGDFLSANKVTTSDGETMMATGSRAAFVQQLRAFAKAEGMGPLDPKDKGGLKDITSERRLGLIFDTQTRQAGDYGYWKQGMNADVLNEFPAQRFIRVLSVKEPRTSHALYVNQVYLKTDPIWARVINEDFHVPWGPWAWGCGHDVEDVDRQEAEELNLIQPGQRLEPLTKHFNENLQASTRGLAPELIEKLKKVFGEQISVEGDMMRWVARPVQSSMSNVQSRLAKSLATEEALLAERRGTEKVVVLDPVGKVLLQKEGSKDRVVIPPDEQKGLEDGILTHNHPIGLSFSAEDLQAAASLNLSEIRIVGVQQPFTFVLERPIAGWPADMVKRYRALWLKNDLEYQTKYMAGEMTEEQAAIDATHQAMLDLADELNLNYERISR